MKRVKAKDMTEGQLVGVRFRTTNGRGSRRTGRGMLREGSDRGASRQSPITGPQTGLNGQCSSPSTQPFLLDDPPDRSSKVNNCRSEHGFGRLHIGLRRTGSALSPNFDFLYILSLLWTF